MQWLRKFEYFKESKNNKPYSKSLIIEICSSMVLLNNEFLDNILDRGLKARYSENSHVFLTDLKNLLSSNNRLKLGKFENKSFVEDDDISKIRGIFESIDFNLENDWSKLVESRNIARGIIDKLLVDEKLTSDRIEKIFWIGPNKSDDIIEDIVIETTDGIQHSIILNKSLSLQKTASFSKFADDIIPNDIDNLYSEENMRKWDKLTQEWIRIVYECSNKKIQEYIERFIDTKRIDSIGYFEYFDIRHRDPRFKYLGEYFKEFEKNILKFSDLMNEIWKKKESFITDIDRATKEWNEIKVVILNSRILEHLFTTSLKSNNIEDIKRLDDGFKKASGTVKMKLMKSLVNKLGCLERPIYYFSNSGNVFYEMPSREFFRQNYESMDIHFDYHVKFNNEMSEESDFNIKLKLILNEKDIILLNILVGFTGSEFSGKLSAKYKFEIPSDFGYQILKLKEVKEDIS